MNDLPPGYEEEADDYASLGYILWYDEEAEYIPYHHPYRVTNKENNEIAFFDTLQEATQWRLKHTRNSSTGGRISTI